AVGSEFGGRHGLYETNYAGNHEDIRIQALWHARGSGTLDGMIALADRCLADYDENGWRDSAWIDPDRSGDPGITAAEGWNILWGGGGPGSGKSHAPPKS